MAPHSNTAKELARRLRDWVQVKSSGRWPTRSMNDDLLAVIEFLERSDGPNGEAWKKVPDGEGDPAAVYINHAYVERGQKVAFWTMYLGGFYECSVALPKLEDASPSATVERLT